MVYHAAEHATNLAEKRSKFTEFGRLDIAVGLGTNEPVLRFMGLGVRIDQLGTKDAS